MSGTFGRQFFDSEYYLQQNPDVLSAIATRAFQGDAWTHFQQYGRFENRAANENFNATQYLAANPDVLAAVNAKVIASAWDHFVGWGMAEGRASGTFSGTFNEAAYLAANPDVAAAVGPTKAFASGYQHYLLYGQAEGRAASNTAGQQINNDNQPFTLTTSAPIVTEGDAGEKAMTFQLTLDRAPTSDIVVSYGTIAGGSATASNDFAPVAGAVTFKAGELAASVTVRVLGDRVAEGDETVTVRFVGEKLARSVDATGTITNDDFVVGAVSDANAAANSVAENAAVGTAVGITARAVDTNALDVVTYSLTTNPGNLFAIDAATGVISVNGALDHETAVTHAVTVKATSSDGSSSSQDFTIAVTNVNDNGVSEITDISLVANAVAENSAVGTTVGLTASASDADRGATVTYSLVNADGSAYAGPFAIGSSTGIVTVAGAVNYEAAASHTLFVKATSSDGSTATRSFDIAVNDVIDADQGYTLRSDVDVATANIFTSVPAYTPGGNDFVNTLQDEDILTGTGSNPTLNVTLGSVNDDAEAMITPTLNGIQTVNVVHTAGGTNPSGINFQDATGLTTLNVNRVVQPNANLLMADLNASVTNLSLNNATRAGTVTFAHKEEVLEGTTEVLNVAISGARAAALNLTEGGDGGADQGFYFETINVASSGRNDFDAVTIQANGREDVVAGRAADTTKQALNINVTSGSMEINSLAAGEVDTMGITVAAGTRLDIAADKAQPLSSENDGITTPSMETVTISGAGGVMIDGLDTTHQAAGGVLTVAAAAHSGGLKLGVQTGADSVVTGSGLAAAVRTTDVDLAVTTGSGADEVRVYTNLAGSITTNDGADTVVISNGARLIVNSPALGDIDFDINRDFQAGDTITLRITDRNGTAVGSDFTVTAPSGASPNDIGAGFASLIRQAIDSRAHSLGLSGVNVSVSQGDRDDIDVNYEWNADLYVNIISSTFDGDISSEDNDGQAVNSGPWTIDSPFSFASVTVVNGLDMEGMSRVNTGAGNDTVAVVDLLAYGDLIGDLQNSGDDSAAAIDTGSDADTATVRNLNSAISWDDNDPTDVNVDDRYAFVGASVSMGDGTDTLNISGTMAENTDVDMGGDGDTVAYTIAGISGAVLADDTSDDRERVSVNSATEAVDESPVDLDGAVITLGAGNDTITFTDVDLPETDTTLLAAFSLVQGAGAKLAGGLGTDRLVVNTTDNLTVVGVATIDNSATLITGIELIDININNAVDAATNALTGVAITDTADMQNTAVFLDVQRVDSDLATINLNSLEQRLRTLTNSEISESGDDTTFFLFNMRTGVTLNVTGFEATGVVGADNNVVATGARRDDTILSISTTSTNNNEVITGAVTSAPGAIDVDIDIEYDEVDAGGLNDTHTINFTSTESMDVRLHAHHAGLSTGVATLDDRRLIENLVLNFTDANAHSIHMWDFGDHSFRTGSRAPVAADDVSSTAVTSLIINTGTAAGRRFDIDDVNADTIRVQNAAGTAPTAADVTLRVDRSNNYTIVTGSGADIIDMRRDDVRADDLNTSVDRADRINAGDSRDTMLVNGDDDLGTNNNAGVSPSTIINDDAFAGLDSIETIIVDTYSTTDQGGANGNLMITLDEQAGTGVGNTNVDTVRMIGDQANRLDLVIGNNFTVGANLNSSPVAGNTLIVDAAGHIANTTLNIENKDDDTDIQMVNMDIRVAATNGTVLNIIDSGRQAAQVEVRVYTSAENVTNRVDSANGGDADGEVQIVAGHSGDQTAGMFDKLIILEGSTSNNNAGTEAANLTVGPIMGWSAAGAYQNVAGGATGDAYQINARWTNTAFELDASAVLDSDTGAGTGGALITAAYGDGAALTLKGTQNSDHIVGGRLGDTIAGNGGNDQIIGDEVTLRNELEVVTFAATYDRGDVITVTHNGDTVTATVGSVGTVTGAQIASAIAGTVVANITVVGTFGAATSTSDGNQLRLTGTTIGQDYVVTADVNNASDIAATPNVIVVDTNIDLSADTDPGLGGSDVDDSALLLVINGITYVFDENNQVADLQTIVTAANAASATYDAFNDKITLTGRDDGTAMNIVTQAYARNNYDLSLSAATITNTAATGLPSDQSAPAVVTETLAATVLGAADTITGGAGTDIVAGLLGGDSLDGGEGSDTLDYSLSDAGVAINLTANTASGGHATGDTIVNFESIIGSVFNDTLTGSGAANTLHGGRGDDTISGGGEADTIIAGEGADSITGGTGADGITLGTDGAQDVLFYASGDGPDTILGFEVAADILRFTDFADRDLLPASILHQAAAAGANAAVSGNNTELLMVTGDTDMTTIDTTAVAAALNGAFNVANVVDGRLMFAIHIDSDASGGEESTVFGYYTNAGTTDAIAAADIEILGVTTGLLTQANFWQPVI